MAAPDRMLSIAEVALTIDAGQLSLPADFWQHRSSRSFVLNDKDRPDQSHGQIHIFLSDAAPPDITGYEKIFDSQDSWAVFSHHDELYIIDQYPPFSEPVWTARLCLEDDRVDIYCSSRIIEPRTRTLTVNPVAYPLDQILLMNYLAGRQGVIIHAAGWAINGSGWTFPGKSGAGKTTLSRFLSGLNTGEMLSDDRIVITKSGRTFQMYGTPWPGEGGFAVNRGASLERLVFLAKGKENRLVPLPVSEVISRLLPVLSIPWYDKQKAGVLIDFCDQLIKQVPAYELTFRSDATVADFCKERIHEFNT